MKVKKAGYSIQCIAIGAGVGLIIIMAASMLLGLLVVRGIIPERFIPIGGAAATVIGTVTAALYSSRGTKKLVMAILTGTLLLLFLLIIHGVAFRDTTYVWLPSVICVLAAALLTGVVRSLKPRKRRY